MAANARPSHTTRRGHCRLDSCGTLSRTPNVPWVYGPTGARRQARSSFDKKRLTFCAKAGRCLAASPGDRELASSRIPPPQRSTPVPINHRDRSGREPRVFLVPEPPQKQVLAKRYGVTPAQKQAQNSLSAWLFVNLVLMVLMCFDLHLSCLVGGFLPMATTSNVVKASGIAPHIVAHRTAEHNILRQETCEHQATITKILLHGVPGPAGPYHSGTLLAYFIRDCR